MTEQKNPDNGAMHTELGLLPKLIALPRQPVSVIWRLTENLEWKDRFVWQPHKSKNRF